MGRNPNIMIVDEDESFLRRLGAAVGEGYRAACCVKAFSDKNKAMKALKSSPPDGLIISEGMYDEELKTLYKGSVSIIAETGGSGVVSRYSGVSVILKTLGDVGNTVMSAPGRESGRVTGIFSFCEPCIRTAYALTRAAIEGKTRRTLYICLDEFPSFAGEDALSFSDAIYEFRKNFTLRGYDLSQRTGKAAGFEYLSPALCMDDLTARTPDELESFSQSIINECGYERIIFDMGNLMTGKWNMDMYCDDMEAVCRPTVERQMNALESFLFHSGRTSFLERMKRINVGTDLEGYTGELEWEMNSAKWMNRIS